MCPPIIVDDDQRISCAAFLFEALRQFILTEVFQARFFSFSALSWKRIDGPERGTRIEAARPSGTDLGRIMPEF
jgi:hypothetical protein